jgi:serine/threonine-protein kinase
MIDRQSTRFWKAALQSGIVDPSNLERCWDEIPAERRTADAIDRRLARRVVERGLMTRWQAQQLLAGVRPQALWFDRYLVEDMIGQGGMGRVYLAKDKRLGRRVALKVLSRERMNSPRAMARFRREAKVGARLQHDNLVRIYDEGEVGGNPTWSWSTSSARTSAGCWRSAVRCRRPSPPGWPARSRWDWSTPTRRASSTAT